MFIISGLGNPGLKYQNTLHNAGFIMIDQILHNLHSKAIWQEKFSGIYIKENMCNENTLFIKPQGYMNHSGICISQFKNFYKVENNNIFIFHDDIDLQPGQIKIKTGGGHAGHNGLKSIDAHIGNDYHRIRIGVGKCVHKEDVPNFVLSQFKDENLAEIIKISDIFSKNIKFLLEKQFSILKGLL